jgi:cytosine/adenosine deaminase-related metal-dependent hydrolase
MNKLEADIVIKNGMILTMNDKFTLHEKADLAIAGSKIVDISLKTEWEGKKVIDASGKLVMPGLINTHTHAAMTMMRGLADDMPLDVWWKRFVFPIEKELLSPEFIRIGVSLAAIEMIKSGTTSFSDMYFFEDTAAQACKKIGIRAFLGEGLLDFPSPDCTSPEETVIYIVHCVHLSHEDMEIMAKRKVKVAHCQESNMKLASGNAPIVELRDKGVVVGLGTDGAASNNNLDMFDEMDATAKVSKLVKNDPGVMDARSVLSMATAEGAKVLQKTDIGTLETGKIADIIIVNLKLPHLTPLYNAYSHLVYSAGGSDVDTVIINGKAVMEERKLLTVDEEEVMDQARHLAGKIRAAVA